MDNISIKDHPPWYARGTPVINIRDGPAMALNDILLLAICREPSARGEPGEVGKCMNAIMRECMNEEGTRPPERCSRAGNPDNYQGEDRSRGKPMGKSRRWLTLKTTFFNTQNNVYSQWYAVLGRKAGVGVGLFNAVKSEDVDRLEYADRWVVEDLSACVAPDNVKMMEDNFNGRGDVGGEFNAVKSEDVDRLEYADRLVVGDLSACVAPDNVNGCKDVDVSRINAVKACPGMSGSKDVDRLEDADKLVDADLSACLAPDNVKMMEDNVKLIK